MTRLPTTTKAGNTHYPNCYKNLQQDYAAVNRQLKSRDRESKTLHDEIHRQSNNNVQLMLDNEQLKVEASMSVANRKEMEFYKKSARLWCICSTLLLVGILAVAVWL